MITKVRICNFKAIEDLCLPLERLTVFVGPNGAGKTSVLAAVHFLIQALFRHVGVALNGDFAVLRRGSKGPIHLEMTWEGLEGTRTFAASLPFKSGKDGALVLGDHSAIDDGASGDAGLEAGAIRERIASAVFLQLSARQLTEPSYSEEEVPVMRPDGTGLASVLADLATSQPDSLLEIMDRLRAVVPAVRRVRTQRARINLPITELHTVDGQTVKVQKTVSQWGHSVVLDMKSGDNIPIRHVSEGTVLTLGLCTVFCGRQRPSILMMDDIDKALHPKAQADLVGVLRRLLEASPELQILATSHSPYLLDELRFEEVRLLTTHPDGTVVGSLLTEHPDYQQWRDSVRPGELWTSRLETWLTEKDGPAA